MADEIGKGINTLKHLPPIALVGIVVVGVGGVLFIRSRKGSEDTNAPATPTGEVDEYEPVKIGAVERGPVGALPESIYAGTSNPADAAVPPRRDPAILDAKNDHPVAPGVTIEQGLHPIAPHNGAASTQVPVQSGGTGAVANPILPAAPVTVSPPQVYNPTQTVKHYPGLPDNYVLKADAIGYRGFLGSYDHALKMIRDKGQNSTVTQRQMSQIAVGGFPKDEAIRGGEYSSMFNRAFTNQKRVYSGLRPLTNEEFDAMQKDMMALWGGNEHDKVFQSGQYAQTLFNKWNLPYQFKG
jgi:hypothetical protein